MACAAFACGAETVKSSFSDVVLGSEAWDSSGRPLNPAQAAQPPEPQSYMAQYYVGRTHLGLEQYQLAAEAADRALALAPPEAKADVTKLVETIKARQLAVRAAQEAAQALTDGMLGKAARLYEEAWNANQENLELGLKVAELYVHKLAQPLDAGRVLRQVRRIATGDLAVRADAMIKELAFPLRLAAKAALAKARAAKELTEQQRFIQQAYEADPDFVEIYQFWVKIAAQGDDESEMKRVITELARRNQSSPEYLAKLPDLARWLAMPSFREFLVDIIGAAHVERLAATDAVDPKNAEDQPREIEDLAMRLMPIAPGRFTMGSNAGDEDEKPVHAVVISRNFWLGQTEVTQAQWAAVMASNPSYFKGENLPVEQVGLEECLEFCRKLTERERSAGRLSPEYAYRLPVEAEWEYACRAGTTSEFAGNLNAMVWQKDNSGGTTHPVGQKQPNAWGLYDMHGNVWEWCGDLKRTYTSAVVIDPVGEEAGPYHAYRGGSWFYGAALCRSALRTNGAAGVRGYILGFRVALSVVP